MFRRTLRVKKSAALLLVVAFVCLASRRADANTPGHDLWLVSTRGAGCGSEPALQYWHFAEGPGWLQASMAEFLAADQPGVPTVVWVHGNRIGFCESQNNGLRCFRSLSCRAADKPFRFVVWSWPADQVAGQLDDVRLKANRSDCEAYHLAWLVNQIHPQVPVSLLGYSYGARLSSGALHILGGGHVNGRALADLKPGRAPMRGVMMAGALDNHWLAPGHRLGQAFNPVDRMLVFINPGDKVLSKYHLLYGWRKGPQALGSTGVCGGLGEHSAKLMQVNASGVVGTTHDWSRYMESPQLISRMRPYALFE
ncbi:MAG: hypothetical protein AB7O62_06145 [Pirellulales bacterium]